MQQVSFVNSISTSRGGTHVDYIVNQLVAAVTEQITKKHKNLVLKPFQVKQHLFIFINCLLVNPTFDSQTKEKLTLKPAKFGSECRLSEKFIKGVIGSGVLESIIENAKKKEMLQMEKGMKGNKRKKLVGIQKLDDANEAGSRMSD